MKWSVVTTGRAYYLPMVILYRITDHYNVYIVQGSHDYLTSDPNYNHVIYTVATVNRYGSFHMKSTALEK